jgi:hypothetical protein
MNAKRLKLNPVPPLSGLAEAAKVVPDVVQIDGKRTRNAVAQPGEPLEVNVEGDSNEENAFETDEDETSRISARPQFRMPPPLPTSNPSDSARSIRSRSKPIQLPERSDNEMVLMSSCITTVPNNRALCQNKRKRDRSPPLIDNSMMQSKFLRAAKGVARHGEQVDTHISLFSALQALLNRLLALFTSSPPSPLITGATLRKIAATSPKDTAAMCRIPGGVPFLQYCKAHQVDLFAFLKEHG